MTFCLINKLLTGAAQTINSIKEKISTKVNQQKSECGCSKFEKTDENALQETKLDECPLAALNDKLKDDVHQAAEKLKDHVEEKTAELKEKIDNLLSVKKEGKSLSNNPLTELKEGYVSSSMLEKYFH